MGYCAQFQSSTFTIKNDHRTEVVKIWKLLNHPSFNKYKTGGDGFGHKWYAWLDEDYDQHFHTVEDIATHLGFYHTTLSNGDVLLTDFEGKTGAEDIFLDAIQPYTSGEIYWVGEDGATWMYDSDEELSPRAIKINNELSTLLGK